MSTVTYSWQSPTSGPPGTCNIYEGGTSGSETLLASVPGTQTIYTHGRGLGLLRRTGGRAMISSRIATCSKALAFSLSVLSPISRKDSFMMGFHMDWTRVAETIVGGAGVSTLTWFLGRRAQEAREKLDTRTQDQKNIDQLLVANAAIQGRVGTLEGQMAAAHEKIEDLRSEKMELELKVVGLTKEIAKLELLKAEYESRDAMGRAQFRALEMRLTAKEEELRCAVAELDALKEKMKEKQNYE